ncbi:MAG TPA: hypothetical protein VFR68_09365 [Candidatus Dormibacteraeota bacterium]|nr:hypothetical protein [Candidatus Dormibacteraeota bacterium]
MLGVIAVAAGALSAATSILPVAAKDSIVARAAKGQLPAARLPLGEASTNGSLGQAQGQVQVYRTLPTLSAGVVQAAKEALDADARGSAGDTGAPAGAVFSNNSSGQAPNVSAAGEGSRNALGVSAQSLGCSDRNPDGNVRVNQDCTYRRQAEEIVKVNPVDSSNIIASQNDSRVGYNQCGTDYSFDGGKTWGDALPPFRQRENRPTAPHTIAGGPGTNHTYDFASDPAQTFDSQGRAFFSCVVLDVRTNASSVLVTASPKGAGGSFYNNVPASGSAYVVVEDNSPNVSHDKEFITADAYTNSPNRDNVYVTWTPFMFDTRCVTPDNPGGYCSSPIWGSMSTNHGVTWSKPEEISGTSDTLCFFGNFFDPTRNPHACTFDQGSDPAVLPNGDLEVVFNNGNTPGDVVNGQTLGVHCHPTGKSNVAVTDPNYAHLNCAAPSKVGDDVSFGEPQCNFGRGPEECIPGAYIRTNDFPRIAVNKGNGHLYSTWQDYCSTRNTVSQTFQTPGGPVTLKGFCPTDQREFDIQISQSFDGGITWQQASEEVNPSEGKDHYFPAIDIVTSGGGGEAGDNRSAQSAGSGNERADHVGISYYRTNRVPNENATPAAGFAPRAQPGVQAEASDYALSGGRGLETPYGEEVISPTFPPPDGIQAGFNGDYSGLALVGSTAHPVWSDTRNAVPPQFNDPTPQGVVRDEDVFTDAIRLPDERGE